MKNENEYFEGIKKGLENALAWKQGKKTGAIVHKFSAMDVAKIRKKTKMSQKEFSTSFRIPLSTLRQWEQGKRVPQGPAQALLMIVDKNAKMALEALH